MIAPSMKEGRIKLDPAKIDRPVSYHDPCQMARNAGVIDAPRGRRPKPRPHAATSRVINLPLMPSIATTAWKHLT